MMQNIRHLSSTSAVQLRGAGHPCGALSGLPAFYRRKSIHASRCCKLLPGPWALSVSISPPTAQTFTSSTRVASSTTPATFSEKSLRLRGSNFNREKISKVPIEIGGRIYHFSSLLLRDACQCPRCVHPTSGQRLFAQADMPVTLRPRSVEVDQASDQVTITWMNDAPNVPLDHSTTLRLSHLKNVAFSGVASGLPGETQEHQVLWPLDPSSIPDYDFDAYMHDDMTLYRLMRQLRVHGVAFVTHSPQSEDAIAAIATRIGPIKDTFYGATWDVRTVPEAVNAAYTSSELGFHTDLLYFWQPPHIQLLHCVQSASAGGASVFTDAHKAAVDLYNTDFDAFNILATTPVNLHYSHPNDNIYRTTKPVIGMKQLRVGNTTYDCIENYITARRERGMEWTEQTLIDSLDKCNWGPPFSAPFSLDEYLAQEAEFAGEDALEALNAKVEKWHDAAVQFNAMLQRPEYLFERKLNPGDCVLFDNTRTLHSRKAFDHADVGKPRWLRGTYIDKDPFLSKMRVLRNKFG